MKQHSQVTKALLYCGVVGGFLFIFVFMLLGVVLEGYDPIRHTVSSLAIGSKGWIQIANFIVNGMLFLLCAQGMRRMFTGDSGEVWGPRLIAIFGFALIGAGIFVTDPEFGYPPGTPPGPAKVTTWHGEWHGLFAILLFVTLMIACFVFARRFWSKTDGRKWAIYSIITGGIIFIFMVLTFNSSSISLVQIHGVLQKMIIIPGWVWISLLSMRLLKELNQ